MLPTKAKPRNCPVGLEPLESRELLSGGPSRHAVITGSASASATPEAAVPITLHLAGSSAPAGNYVRVAARRVVMTG
jgi:hypothetical protein